MKTSTVFKLPATHLTHINISFSVCKHETKGKDLGSNKRWEDENVDTDDAQGLDSLGISEEAASSSLGIFYFTSCKDPHNVHT